MKKLILSTIFAFFLTFGLNTAFATVSIGDLSVIASPSFYLPILCASGDMFMVFESPNGNGQGNANNCGGDMNIGTENRDYFFVDFNTSDQFDLMGVNNIDDARASAFYISEVSYSYIAPPAGCIYSSATNYNPDSLFDDGSCIFDGSGGSGGSGGSSDFLDFLSSSSFLLGSLFANILVFVLLPLVLVVVFIRFIKKNL